METISNIYNEQYDLLRKSIGITINNYLSYFSEAELESIVLPALKKLNLNNIFSGELIKITEVIRPLHFHEPKITLEGDSIKVSFAPLNSNRLSFKDVTNILEVIEILIHNNPKILTK